MVLFSFPDDARWNPEAETVEFGVSVGDYHGTVRLARQTLHRLMAGTATPEKCLEAYHLHRTRIERAVEAKLRRRELSEDGNVDLTGRDLRHAEGER